MQTKYTFVTEEGLNQLKNELEYLKITRRQEVAAAIKQATSFGDLSENSEYDEAKNEQGEVEKRIAEIEKMLDNVKIISANATSSVVSVGSKVKIFDTELEEEASYQIVGSTEADPSNSLISDESPIGKALLNKKPGDLIEVITPGGVIKIELLAIL
ncbi:MAG: transcription elongation factor GreA [Oscillospiraceae bacterium]|nr:transcription elongation factor GreA [Oscillospiraceae bacterium]